VLGNFVVILEMLKEKGFELKNMGKRIEALENT